MPSDKTFGEIAEEVLRPIGGPGPTVPVDPSTGGPVSGWDPKVADQETSIYKYRQDVARRVRDGEPIDPATIPDWDWIWSALKTGESADVTGVGQVTPVLTPELRAQGYVPLGREIYKPPTFDGWTEEAMGAWADFIKSVDTGNPYMASQLAASPNLMMLLPEIVGVMQNTLKDAYTTEAVLEALSGELEMTIGSYRSVEQHLNESPVTSEFLHTYSNSFTPLEKDTLATYLAAIPDGRRRENVSAMGIRYLEENPDALDDAESRGQFLFWLQNRLSEQVDQEAAEQSWFGKLGAALDAPRLLVAKGVSAAWAWLTGPEDYAWRSALTPGQNAAVSAGLDPSDDGWRDLSGTVDFLGAIFGDPLNWAFGVGIGYKAAKGIPLAPDALKAGRAVTAGKSAIPWFGRKATSLPFGSRQISSRLAFTAFGKSADKLVESKKFVRVAERIVEHNEAGRGVIELVEMFPNLKGKETGLAKMLNESTTVRHVQDVLLHGLSGTYLSKGEEGYKAVELAASRRTDDLRRAIVDALNSGDISIADLPTEFKNVTGITAERGVFSLLEDGRLAPTELAGAGAEVTILPVGTKMLDLADSKEARKFGRWVNKNLPSKAALAVTEQLAFAERGITSDMGTGFGGLVQKYVKAMGKDAVKYEDGIVDLAATAKPLTVLDYPATGNIDSVLPRLQGLQQEYMSAMLDFNRLKQGDRTAWFIKDMPKKPNVVARKAPWNKLASNNGTSWLAEATRRGTAYVFGNTPPRDVDINNVPAGLQDIQAWMKRFGAKQETVVEWSEKFLAADSTARYSLVWDMVDAVADEVDHPILRNSLKQLVNKEGQFAFARMGGAELAVATSRSNSKFDSARPILSIHLTDKVPLPGQEYLTMLNRYRQSGKLPKPILKGWGKTDSARANLAARFQRALTPEGSSVSSLDADEALRYAYSYVGGEGMETGVGKVVDYASRGLVGPWSWMHSKFKKAMLVLRPFTWPLRVVVLEEQARGALMGMPSMYRNPAEMMGLWWDTYLTSRHTVWKQQNADQLRRVTSEVFQGKTSFADATEAAKGIIHNWDELVKDLDVTTAGDVRAFTNKVLRDQINGGSVEMTEKMGPRFRARIKKIEVADARINKRYADLGTEFGWGDIKEIQNKGLVNLFAEEAGAASPVVGYVPGQMTEVALHNYGHAYGRTTYRLLEDPFVKNFVLSDIAAAARGGKSTGASARNMVGTREWRVLRQNIIDVGRRREWDADGMTDVVLAQRYLDEILTPYVREVFAPFLGDTPESIGDAADALRRGDTVAFTLRGTDNYDFVHTADNYDEWVRNTQKMVEDGLGNDTVFPKDVAGYFDPRFLKQGNKGIFNSISNNVIQFSGNQMTQALNRRPAWLSTYRRLADHYTAMGLPADIAKQVASEEASKAINFVYYNMSNPTPFLRTMNNVVPFFGAMWEVAQTWAYKIPAQSVAGVGYGRMVHQIDKTLGALQALGILTVDSLDYEPGETPLSTQFKLRFESAPQTGTMVGDAMSKAGYFIQDAPRALAEHFVNLRNALTPDVEEGNPFGLAPHYGYEFSVGNPLDPASHGIMATSQLSLGLAPPGLLALQGIVNRAPFVGDRERHDTEGGDTMVSLAADLDLSVAELLVTNREELKKALGDVVFADLQNGLIEDAPLPAGVPIQVSNSSWARSLVTEAFFPFGQTYGPQGAIYSYAPSWLQFTLRGLGLWQSSHMEGDYWNIDKEGRLHFQSGLGGFLELLLPPEQKASMAGRITEALFYLESTDVDDDGVGIITRQQIAAQKLNDLKANTTLRYEDTNGDLVILSEGHPDEDKFTELYEDARFLDEQIISRATDIAAASEITRGLVGLVSPGNPQLVYDQLEESRDYYASRDAVDMARESNGNVMSDRLVRKIKSPDEVDKFRELAARWIVDPTGDASKQWLVKNNKELLPFLLGKTFWGPGGVPPQTESYTEHVYEMREGLRTPYAPDISMMRIANQAIALEKETLIVDAFGNDPTLAALGQIEDPRTYSDIQTEISQKYDAVAYWDDLHNNGNFTRWRERNRDDTPNLMDEIQREFTDIIDTADVLDALSPEYDLSTSEAKAISNSLGAVSRNMQEFINTWRDRTKKDGYNNPREEVVAQYFEKVVGPYYEMLSDKWDTINASVDTEEQSLLYDDLRLFITDEYQLNPMINGVVFPNTIQWSWAKKTEEEQQLELLKYLRYGPERLDLAAASHLIEQSPQLAEFIPSTPEDFVIYREYNAAVQQAQELQEPSEEFPTGQITDSEYRKAKKWLDEKLESELIRLGRKGELDFVNTTPLERLDAAGMMPEAFRPWMKEARAVRDLMIANDEPETGGKAKLAFDYMWLRFVKEMEGDPYLRREFERLGDQMFDESAWDRLFMRLVAGAASFSAEI